MKTSPTELSDSERHSRKCSICHHPHRDAIEEEFLHWHRVIWIAQQYQLPDHRSIYRHARATGLIQARRENLHSALDNIVEQSDGIQASASDVLKAIRAYSCLDAATGRWTELPAPPAPPKQVHLTYTIQSPSSGHGFRDLGVPDASAGNRAGQSTQNAAASAAEGSAAVAAGGPMPTKGAQAGLPVPLKIGATSDQKAEAPASGLVGQGFSPDIKKRAEGPSTDEGRSGSQLSNRPSRY